MPSSPQPANAFTTLRRFLRSPAPLERCELCSTALVAHHQHLLASDSRHLLCACDACALLFSSQNANAYRRLPQYNRSMPDFYLPEAQWERLMIPIGLAFFFHSTAAGKMLVSYPSPAGPMESMLDPEPWEEIVQHNPILRELQPDVEALLVNRVEPTHAYYLVPIDVCYRLVGLIRTAWQGLSGGTEVWQVMKHFFFDLQQRSSVRNTQGVSTGGENGAS